MSKLDLKSVTNCNVYLQEVNLLGRANEVTLPVFKSKQNDHKGLGMMSEMRLPTAGFEATEAKYKWQSFYPEILRRTPNPRKSVRFQIRASLETYSSDGLDDESSVIITLGGPVKETTFGTFKQQEAVMPEHTQEVWYYRLVVSGEELLLVDVPNNIYRAAGDDIMSTFRRLIGG